MIRKLSLLRHAQSADKQPGQADIDRELTQRGRSDAVKIGEAINKLNINFDLVISGTALRTKATSLVLVSTTKFEPKKIQWDERIYEASVMQLLAIFQELSANLNSVLMVGHNPSITYLAAQVVGKEMNDLPPCGFVMIEFSNMEWSELRLGSGKIISRLDPANLGR